MISRCCFISSWVKSGSLCCHCVILNRCQMIRVSTARPWANRGSMVHLTICQLEEHWWNRVPSPQDLYGKCAKHTTFTIHKFSVYGILSILYIHHYSPLFTPKMTLLSVDDPLKTWTCGEWGWRGGAMTILWWKLTLDCHGNACWEVILGKFQGGAFTPKAYTDAEAKKMDSHFDPTWRLGNQEKRWNMVDLRCFQIFLSSIERRDSAVFVQGISGQQRFCDIFERRFDGHQRVWVFAMIAFCHARNWILNRQQLVVLGYQATTIGFQGPRPGWQCWWLIDNEVLMVSPGIIRYLYHQ